MKLAILAAVALFGVAFSADCKRDGYWGEDCNNVCGYCKDNKACNKSDGNCPSTSCEEGWESLKGETKCNKPICFGLEGCSFGKCVAPNYCVCGAEGAQIVGKEVERIVNGKKHTGIDCVSLRMDGIKGAGIAMLVMFVSIGICGGIERMRNKNKSKIH